MRVRMLSRYGFQISAVTSEALREAHEDHIEWMRSAERKALVAKEKAES